MRVFIELLTVLLLPFLLWTVYAFFSKRYIRKGGLWVGAPVRLMGFVSLLSILAVMLYYVSLDSGDREGIYRPARLENGKLIPGGFVKPQKKEHH